MKRVCLFVVSLVSLFSPYMSIAKSGDEHIRDMIDVYPFKAQYGDLIYTFFECVQAAIDYSVFNPKNQSKKSQDKPAFLTDRIQNEFINTTWAYGGPYNHRFWYHWGFQVDLKSVRHLSQKVQENIDAGRMKEEHRDLFYQRLYKEVRERNNELMTLAAEILIDKETLKENKTLITDIESWSPAMKAQFNAFVAIPYAVHLLGDHIKGKVVNVLQPIDGIVKSVYKAIDDLSGRENMPLAKKLKKNLSPYEKSPEDFLNALKKHLPKYMLSLRGGIYDIKKKCRNNGYEIKDELSFPNMLF